MQKGVRCSRIVGRRCRVDRSMSLPLQPHRTDFAALHRSKYFTRQIHRAFKRRRTPIVFFFVLLNLRFILVFFCAPLSDESQFSFIATLGKQRTISTFITLAEERSHQQTHHTRQLSNTFYLHRSSSVQVHLATLIKRRFPFPVNQWFSSVCLASTPHLPSQILRRTHFVYTEGRWFEQLSRCSSLNERSVRKEIRCQDALLSQAQLFTPFYYNYQTDQHFTKIS